MNPFDALLADFAQKTGLEFGGPGTDSLDLEADGVAVCAQYRAERDDCVVFSLPLEDTEPDGPMLRCALELAANGGGTDGFFLGLKEGMFMLSAVLPLGGLSAEEFGRRLIALGAAQYAKDHLPGFPVEQLPGDGEDDPGMTAMKLDEVHFRVLLACMFDDEGKPDMAHLTERLGRFTENDIQALKDEILAKAVANLVVRHGTGMPAWKLSILANYIVSRKADPNTPVAEAKVAQLVTDMKRWKNFGLEDNMVLRQLGGKVAEIANAHVQEKFNDGSWFMGGASQQGKNKRPVLPNVAEQFYLDITSGSWNFGNGTIELDPKMSKEQTQAFTQNVLDQFNKTIDDKIPSEARRGAAKKVLSTLLHQGNFSELEFLTRKEGQLAGVPGADFFVSKTMGDDDWESIVTGSTKAMGLEISEDGTTATVTVSIGKTITSNGSSMDNHKIGTVLLCQKMTVDLTKDIPEVTDVKFSQKISTDKTDLTARSIAENLQIDPDGPAGIED